MDFENMLSTQKESLAPTTKLETSNQSYPLGGNPDNWTNTFISCVLQHQSSEASPSPKFKIYSSGDATYKPLGLATFHFSACQTQGKTQRTKVIFEPGLKLEKKRK